MGLYSKAHIEHNPPTEEPVFPLELGEIMMKGGDRTSPQPSRSTPSSVGNTPPSTPLTPGTPLSAPGTPITPSCPATSPLTLGLSTTPSYPGPYRHRLPSFTESDSQSSTRDTLSDDGASQSDSQSDVASMGSSAAELNFDITPLVKKELKDAIITRRKTMGLPDVKVDFSPRLPDKLTPEEEERRQQQKERNREAASKCRSKKRNAVGRLVEEAQQLETENSKLRDEMKALEAERSRLQFLLDMHSPKCMRQNSPLVNTITASHIQLTDSINLDTSIIESARPLKQSPSSDIMSIQNLTVFGETVATRPQRSIMESFCLPQTSSETHQQSRTEPPATTTPNPQNVPTLGDVPNAGATRVTSGSLSPYGSSCFPPTPSTTHSQSCTEPSTPATPNSAMDDPYFPTISLSNPPLSTAKDSIVQNTSTSVLPNAHLASSSISTLSDAFSISDLTDFPSFAPPTPELLDDPDDPLSESFVKQYLGMDTFLAADLPLPTLAGNIPDCLLTPANTKATDVASHLEIGAKKASLEEDHSVQTQPRLDHQFLHSYDQHEGEKTMPILENEHQDPTPDTTLTPSLSALLGISIDGVYDDETSSFGLSSNSAIGL